ncbi:hypothetical protein Y032_0045g1152 [Ancylostoma ceylanicum]|nr:hypothetical protein Y032_0045g1152 [Ancylostoma ceylanicum]
MRSEGEEQPERLKFYSHLVQNYKRVSGCTPRAMKLKADIVDPTFTIILYRVSHNYCSTMRRAQKKHQNTSAGDLSRKCSLSYGRIKDIGLPSGHIESRELDNDSISRNSRPHEGNGEAKSVYEATMIRIFRFVG